MDSLCRPHAAVQVHEAPAVPACRRMPQFVEKTAAPPARGLGNPTSWLRVSSVEGSRAVNGRSRRAGRRSCGRLTAETQRAQRTQRWVGVGGREPLGSCRLAPAARHHEGTKNTKGLPERPSHASFRVGRDPQQNGEVGWPPHLPSLFLRGMRRRTGGTGVLCVLRASAMNSRTISADRPSAGCMAGIVRPVHRRDAESAEDAEGCGAPGLLVSCRLAHSARHHEDTKDTKGLLEGGVTSHLLEEIVKRRRWVVGWPPTSPTCSYAE
jgi:hypothetical protein